MEPSELYQLLNKLNPPVLANLPALPQPLSELSSVQQLNVMTVLNFCHVQDTLSRLLQLGRTNVSIPEDLADMISETAEAARPNLNDKQKKVLDDWAEAVRSAKEEKQAEAETEEAEPEAPRAESATEQAEQLEMPSPAVNMQSAAKKRRKLKVKIKILLGLVSVFIAVIGVSIQFHDAKTNEHTATVQEAQFFLNMGDHYEENGNEIKAQDFYDLSEAMADALAKDKIK